ncbi:MAG: hypothetical protein AB9891_17915 [Anaerolineaceae bacterium]
MYNPETEILFPAYLIPELRDERGEKWQQFIDSIPSSPDKAGLESGLVLFLVKQGGCIGCNADSFRAMRGCKLCSQQTIKRFKGSDQSLIDQIQSAKTEIENWSKKQKTIKEPGS